MRALCNDRAHMRARARVLRPFDKLRATEPQEPLALVGCPCTGSDAPESHHSSEPVSTTVEMEWVYDRSIAQMFYYVSRGCPPASGGAR